MIDRENKSKVVGRRNATTVIGLGLAGLGAAAYAGYNALKANHLIPPLFDRKKLDIEKFGGSDADILPIAKKDTDRIHQKLATWAVKALNLSEKEDETKYTERLIFFLQATKGFEELPRMMMIKNPDLQRQYNSKLLPYIEDEYIPEIIQLAEQSDVPPLILIKFLCINNTTLNNHDTFNDDVGEYRAQVVFSALQTFLMERGQDLTLPEIIQIFGSMKSHNGVRAGFENMVRIATPSILGMDIETETIAQGLLYLKERNFEEYDKIRKSDLYLASSASKLIEHKRGLEVHKKLVQARVESYILSLESEGYEKTIWHEILSNPQHPVWKQLGLTGSKDDNVQGMMYNLTNYTFALDRVDKWTALHLNPENIEKGFLQAQADYMTPAKKGNWKKSVREIIIQQLGNPAFQTWFKSIDDDQFKSQVLDVLDSFSRLIDVAADHSKMMIELTDLMVIHELDPKFEIPLTVGTCAYLDNLSNDRVKYPTISRYRNNHELRSLLFQINRYIPTELGGMIELDNYPSIKLASVEPQLGKVDFMMSNLDSVLAIVENKLKYIYQTDNVNFEELITIVYELAMKPTSDTLEKLIGKDDQVKWLKEPQGYDEQSNGDPVTLRDYLVRLASNVYGGEIARNASSYLYPHVN